MYIKDEVITGNGSAAAFSLSERFCNGTVRVMYNGKVFTAFREIIWDRVRFDFAPKATDIITISYYTQNEQIKPNAVRYVTPRQVKLASRATDITKVGDHILEKFIKEAEQIIDGYCGFWEKADSDQLYLFPRKEDAETEEEYSPIPKEITDAAVAITEHLYLKGNPSVGGEIMEERIGDYSYKKSAQNTDLIPEKAKFLLRGFRKLSGKMNLKTE